MRLRKGHLLPEEAKVMARLVKENGPVKKERIVDIVREHDDLDEDCITCNIRLLRMSDNLYIEDGEAFIDPVRCGENGVHVMEKFRRWKNS